MTRGLSLNNPGNVRISDIPWQGKVLPSRDPDFETFDTAEHGIRVIAKILLTYFKRDGLNTIDDIIAKWAPPTENDTDSYIDDVSDRAGFDSDATLTPDLPTLCALVSAIVFHENGCNPYTPDQVKVAVSDTVFLRPTTQTSA